ncbi:MAG: FUSC family protein [Methyloceanibacter sp.]
MPELASRFVGLERFVEPRRGILFLINIGLPILIGVVRGETSAALIGGITGLLLSIADTEGPLGGRLRLTLMVAGGIVAGALLGAWLKAVHPTFWLCFFVAVFAAGLLNQLGKGPHFALRFGAIALAVVASLPEIVPQEYAYFAGTVLLCVLSRSVDHLMNGPLCFSGPWLGTASFDRWGWFRFALAYALSATAGLWIGIETGNIRAVWTSAITLVLMVPDVGMTYRRVFGGMAGTALAVCAVFLVTSISHAPALLCAAIFVAAFLLPSQIMRFWAFSGMIAVIVLLAWDLASGDPRLQPTLLVERMEDMAIGAALVVIFTAALFPRATGNLLQSAWRKAS